MNGPEKRTFQDHFSGCAAGYAAHRPRYPAELAEFLARVSPRRELAWECGCGSGQFTEDLARHFARVLATDASAQQLAQARAHPRIEYRCAPAEASGLSDASADLIVAAQAAHWFDLPAWYKEVRRIGTPGALVAIASYGNPVLPGELDAIVQRFYSEVLGAYWPPERRIIESGYRDIPFPFEEIAVPRIDMSARWTLDQLLGYVGTWSAVRAMEKAVAVDPMKEFRAQMSRAWGDAGLRRDVRWPLALRAGRVDGGSGLPW